MRYRLPNRTAKTFFRTFSRWCVAHTSSQWQGLTLPIYERFPPYVSFHGNCAAVKLTCRKVDPTASQTGGYAFTGNLHKGYTVKISLGESCVPFSLESPLWALPGVGSQSRHRVPKRYVNLTCLFTLLFVLCTHTQVMKPWSRLKDTPVAI